MELLTFLTYLIGPSFAVVQLLISVYAQRKKRNKGSNLMVGGSLLALLHAGLSSFFSYALNNESFDGIEYDYYLDVMPYFSIISLLAGILFLGGLTLFIQSISETKDNWNVIDRRD